MFIDSVCHPDVFVVMLIKKINFACIVILHIDLRVLLIRSSFVDFIYFLYFVWKTWTKRLVGKGQWPFLLFWFFTTRSVIHFQTKLEIKVVHSIFLCCISRTLISQPLIDVVAVVTKRWLPEIFLKACIFFRHATFSTIIVIFVQRYLNAHAHYKN